MATKNQFKVYEDKIKYLQLYLEHMIKEKEEVMQRLEDMKVTAQQNKELLKEYINNITTKDQIVEKLQCTIENLQERIKSQEDYIRKTISIKGLKSSPDKETRRDNNFCFTNRNQVKSGLEDEANYSMTQRVTNNMKHSFNDIKEVISKLYRCLLNRSLFWKSFLS